MATPKPDPQYTGSFHFVNKDATNLRSKSKGESFAIGSHVAGTFQRWEKREKLRNPHTSDMSPQEPTLHALASGQGETMARDKPEAGDHQAPPDVPAHTKKGYISSWRIGPSPRTRIDRSGPHATPKATIPPSSTKKETDKKDDLRKRINEKTSPSNSFDEWCPHPATIIKKGNSDPFCAASIMISPLHNDLMHWWQDRFMVSVWPTYASVKSHAPAIFAWSQETQSAIADEARLHGIFSCALTFKAIVLPQSVYSAQMRPKALDHKAKCMAKLRTRLMNQSDALSTIPAVWQLAATEFFSRDINAAKVHWAAIKRMVESVGGVTTLHWTLQALVIIGDLIVANFSLSRPLFAVKDWDPGPWKEQSFRAKFNIHSIETQELYQAQGSGPRQFHSDIPAGQLGIIKAHGEVVAAKYLTTTLPLNDPFRDAIASWLHMRRYALSARTLDAYNDIMEPPKSEIDARTGLPSPPNSPVAASTDIDTLLNAYTPITVNFMQRFIWDHTLANIAVYVPFHHLRALLGNLLAHIANQPSWAPFSQHALLLWMLFVGACAEEVASAAPQPARWHSVRFVLVARHMQLDSADEIKGVLRAFLYQERVLDPYLMALLDKEEDLMRGAPGLRL